MRINALFWPLLLLPPLALAGQEAIMLYNPSFEDVPQHSKPPTGWLNCGFEGETPPDVHPSGAFDVSTLPQHGSTYLGIITRDNSTWEAVGQALPAPLFAGACYAFSIYAARSPHYKSLSRMTNTPSDYTVPVRLRVWAGNYPCEREELLWETMSIPFVDWTRLDMVLRPSAPYTHLILEAYYDGDVLLPYNGNLLLDNASPLLPVDCNNPRLSNLRLDILEAPPLSTLADLQAFIMEQAQLLDFDASSGLMDRHLFLSEDEMMILANRHLWLIGRAVAQQPKLKIEVFLPKMLDPTASLHDMAFYHKPELMQRHKQGAIDALSAAGLAADRYEIKIGKSPPPHRKAPWLLPERDGQFNLRLIGKFK